MDRDLVWWEPIYLLQCLCNNGYGGEDKMCVCDEYLMALELVYVTHLTWYPRSMTMMMMMHAYANLFTPNVSLFYHSRTTGTTRNRTISRTIRMSIPGNARACVSWACATLQVALCQVKRKKKTYRKRYYKQMDFVLTMHRITVVISKFSVGGQRQAYAWRWKRQPVPQPTSSTCMFQDTRTLQKRQGLTFCCCCCWCENKKGVRAICHRICKMKMV